MAVYCIIGFDAWNVFAWTFEGFSNFNTYGWMCLRNNAILIYIQHVSNMLNVYRFVFSIWVHVGA